MPAGNLIVATIVFDNAATASKPVVNPGAPINRAPARTWQFVGAARSTNLGGAFASGELWAIKTTVDRPGASTSSRSTSRR